MNGSNRPFTLLRPRRARLPAPTSEGGCVNGFKDVRLSLEQAERAIAISEPPAGGPFNILAISGGAAGGAFGAGVLVGLSQAGRRPPFALVTGVSTGALIAPFAFLGSDWDDRLREGYTGGLAAQTLGLRSLSPILDGGLFRSDALERLVFPFIDSALLEAIAGEHKRGRRLFIATTDLDRQKPSLWDMGAIASQGGDEAVALFRNVLIASASVPGLFSPRRFTCEVDGVDYEELHVDGGVTSPLFVLPAALSLACNAGGACPRGEVFVIINTVLEPGSRTTSVSLPSVLMRSFDTMLRVSYRQALSVVLTYCNANQLALNVASIPDSPEATDTGSMLSFATASMRRTFDRALTAAKSGGIWNQASSARVAGEGLPAP